MRTGGPTKRMGAPALNSSETRYRSYYNTLALQQHAPTSSFGWTQQPTEQVCVYDTKSIVHVFDDPRQTNTPAASKHEARRSQGWGFGGVEATTKTETETTIFKTERRSDGRAFRPPAKKKTKNKRE